MKVKKFFRWKFSLKRFIAPALLAFTTLTTILIFSQQPSINSSLNPSGKFQERRNLSDRKLVASFDGYNFVPETSEIFMSVSLELKDEKFEINGSNLFRMRFKHLRNTPLPTQPISKRIPILNHPLNGPIVNTHPFSFTINQPNTCRLQHQLQDEISHNRHRPLRRHQLQQRPQVNHKKQIQTFKILKIFNYPLNSSWWKFQNNVLRNTPGLKNNLNSQTSTSLVTTPSVTSTSTATATTTTKTATTTTTSSLPLTITTTDLYAVIYIHTSPSHYSRRQLIRETWGNTSHHTHSIKILFFMGLPKHQDDVNGNLKKVLELEALLYKDIIQESYLDDYHNLTYKGVGALKWISEYCSNAKYIIKTDDDILVNIFMLFNYLDARPKHMINHNTMFCCVWNNMEVLREGKWRVDPLDFPEDVFPTYCSGSAFIMTTDLALKLYAVSKYVPFFWVDDVYVTGFLPKKLGNVTHVNIVDYYSFSSKRPGSAYELDNHIFIHVGNLTIVKQLWMEIVLMEIGLRI